MKEIKKLNKQLQRLLNEEYYEPEQINEDTLWEMANLAPKETGLPIYIYISNRRYAKHGPRVKFMTQLGTVKPSLLAEITIEDEPRLICNPKIEKAAKKYFKIMVPWVKENKQVLLDLFHDKLTEREASNIIADKYME